MQMPADPVAAKAGQNKVSQGLAALLDGPTHCGNPAASPPGRDSLGTGLPGGGDELK